MKKFNFVYITTNLINGKQYIGDHSTNNLNDNYIGSGRPYLQKAIKKYDKKNFKKEILEFFNTKEEAFTAQEKYIKIYNTLVPNGYNISPKGGMNIFGSWSKESKEKMKKTLSKKLKGRIFTLEWKQKLRNKKIGYIPSVKGIGHRQQLINVYGEKEGIKRYNEFIEKQRNSHLGKKLRGEVWNKGISLSIKWRNNLSKALKGKKHNLKEIKCPHCGLKGKGPNMTRYHFNNCKFKKYD